jgi:phospholipase/carboxylesterase
MITLESVLLEPAYPADAVVIWLHGLGADGYDFVDIVPSLSLPKDHKIRFVFPHAPQQPVTINNGIVMPAWFDILAIDRYAPEDEKGIQQSHQALIQLIEHQIGLGIPASRIIMAGFSQGGALAAYTALRYEKTLAGLAMLSSYLALAQKLPQERQVAHQSMPILVAHGTMDNVVPFSMGELSLSHLQALGYHPTWCTYAMAHCVCAQEMQDMGRWIQDCLSKGI